MTDEEIKKCLKKFKAYINSSDSNIIIDTKRANPFKEYCYISSSGLGAGIYFPNSVITSKNEYLEYFDFYCLCKTDINEFGICYSLKDDVDKAFPDFVFEPFGKRKKIDEKEI